MSSYAVNEDQIKSFIEANSDVEVEVINTSTTPWIVKGEDTLYCTKSGSELVITYETDYIS